MDGGTEKKLIREPLKVIVYMENCRIRGTIFLDLESRLSDFINNEIQFVPIKDALVESTLEREWSYRVNFMDINKNYVISIFPESELTEKW